MPSLLSTLSLLVLLIATAGYYLIKDNDQVKEYLFLFGIGRTDVNHGFNTCVKLKDTLYGCEDIQINHAHGHAYLACMAKNDSRVNYFPPLAHFGKRDDESDPVYIYDLETEKLTRLTHPSFPTPLRTHGIKLYTPPSDPSRTIIFLVNHHPPHSTIEIFSHVHGTTVMTHELTISSPLITTPNNLVPLGPRTVLISNDHKHRNGFMRHVEEIGRFPWSNVVLFHEGETRVVAGGIKGANGMAMSRDGKYVLVNAVAGGEVVVYELQGTGAETGLKEVGKVHVGILNDNLAVDEATGDVYVA
ncbi:hypothetical protein HK104_004632, partial [Borealophlyctis nickersoniae]